MQLPFTKTVPEQLNPYTDQFAGCMTVARFRASAIYFYLFIIRPTKCSNFANLFLPGWNCSSILVLLESCLQTCMTYTIVECTVNKLLVMDRGTVRNMQSFTTKYICEISASSWFYYKEICYDARSHERKIIISHFTMYLLHDSASTKTSLGRLMFS